MALALALSACEGQPRDPFGLGDAGDRPSGRSSSPSPVVGTWEVVLVVNADTDVQRWTTTWRFGSDRTCDFKRVTLSLVEGISRTVERSCRYVDRGGTLEVSYADGTAPSSLPYEIPAFSNDRLILEGVEYERVG
ncbi:MAG: hypothetical protein AB7R55_08725 [Gemmatimonadales bacterium]